MQDERLIYLKAAIAEQNSEFAFNELFRRFFPGLLSFAVSIVKNEHTAEDIIQEVFVKLWENRKILPTVQNLSHYLYIATKHTCLNFIKSKKNFEYEELGESYTFTLNTPESQLMNNEMAENILKAINDLPPRCRLIFRLVKDEGLKYKEVAQLLNISERTVNAQITIATSKISDYIHKSFPEYRTKKAENGL